jgi:hypothetical protein
MASETNCRIWSNSSPDRWSILLSTKNVGDCRAARLFNSVSSRSENGASADNTTMAASVSLTARPATRSLWV